jgi:thiamine biosynthesis protein ThiS
VQQNKILSISINGSKYIFNSKFTVLGLMDYLGFNKSVIVIDYNGSILDKKRWANVQLQNRDHLEILSIAGGG